MLAEFSSSSLSNTVIMKSVMALAGACLVGLALGATTPSASTPIPTFSAQEIVSGSAIRQLSQIAYDNAMARAAAATTGCTKDKVKIRQEWCVAVVSRNKTETCSPVAGET